MFFRLNTTYTDWSNRISEAALAELATTGVAVCKIEGEKEASRLLVNTQDGAFVYVGEFNQAVQPKQALIELLHNIKVEMCAPVRVTALFLLRTLTE